MIYKTNAHVITTLPRQIC